MSLTGPNSTGGGSGGGGGFFSFLTPGLTQVADGLQQIAIAINNLGSQLAALATNIFACCRGFFVVRVITVAGDVTVLETDQIIVMRKTTPQVTNINLLPTPISGQWLSVKDGSGNAFSFPITLVPTSGTMIDNLTTYVMDANKQAVRIVYDGAQWDLT